MFDKITITAAAAAAALLYATNVDADGGPFLTLEVASILNNYESHSCIPDGTADVDFAVVGSEIAVKSVEIGCTGNQTVGDSGWIGSIRAGWSTKTYRAFGPVYVSGHAVYQHISDPKVGNDGGLDFAGVGITFKGKK